MDLLLLSLIPILLFAISFYFVQSSDKNVSRDEFEELYSDLDTTIEDSEKTVEMFLEHFPSIPLGLHAQLIESSEYGIEKYYRPKNGEYIVATAIAIMAKVKDEIKAYNYGGLNASLKIWGPIRFRVGSASVNPVKKSSIKKIGTGMLIVTNKKLIFNGMGHTKDWSRTWNSINTWGVYSDAIQVEVSNGQPIVFYLGRKNALTHPAVMSAIFEYAMDQKNFS